MTDSPPTPPMRAAATLIVLRDAAGPPEILMVERSAAMAFGAGALAFPGGRVEAGDRSAGDDDTAARVAAIRETIEETGLAIGVIPLPEAATVGRWQASLAAGASLVALADADGARLTPSSLIPFARWRPGRDVSRRYDTRFYLARAPAGLPPPMADTTENTRAFWATASDLLAAIEGGTARALFPTRRTLERLACYDSVAATIPDAGRSPGEVITPWIERRDGVDHLCIPEGCGYPITAEPLARAMRD